MTFRRQAGHLFVEFDVRPLQAPLESYVGFTSDSQPVPSDSRMFSDTAIYVGFAETGNTFEKARYARAQAIARAWH